MEYRNMIDMINMMNMINMMQNENMLSTSTLNRHETLPRKSKPMSSSKNTRDAFIPDKEDLLNGEDKRT